MLQHQAFNMKKKIHIGLIGAVLISLIGLIGTVKNTYAAPVALTVFPAIQDINLKPGQQTRFQIQFKNSSDQVISGVVKAADYIVTDKKGSTQLIDKGQLSPKYGAASWITIPTSLF